MKIIGLDHLVEAHWQIARLKRPSARPRRPACDLLYRRAEAESKAAVPNSVIRLDSGNPVKTSVSQYQTARPYRFRSGNFRPSTPTAW
jgi:hypothetical protein